MLVADDGAELSRINKYCKNIIIEIQLRSMKGDTRVTPSTQIHHTRTGDCV